MIVKHEYDIIRVSSSEEGTQMNRNKLFMTAMDLLLKANLYINKYESTPRKYGTDDVLYEVESHTIDMIGKNEHIGVTEIARRMHKSKSAVSQIVNRLMKKGYLLKMPNPESQREVRLILTETGMKVFRYHESFDALSYQEILNNLNDFSDQDFQIYIKIQRTINRSLKSNATK